MRRPPGVRPFAGIIILAGGLLFFGGCRTLGSGEEIPVPRVLPGGYPLYFSLDIGDGGAPVAEILEEQNQPGVVVKTWLGGTRLWGAVPARGGGAPVIVFEGEVPRFKTSLGLAFSRDWKKSEEGDWWEEEQGGQIAFTGKNRLYYSRGGMGALRDREKGLLYPDSPGAVTAEAGLILGGGSLVVLGEGAEVLASLVPLPPGVNLNRWFLRMDRSGEDWRGGVTLMLGEEGQARFLGTTLKLLFLRNSGPSGENDSGPGGVTALLTQRLGQTRVTRRGSELSLEDLVFPTRSSRG
jgi:hypothetical protein